MIKLSKPFLAFTSSFQPQIANNMLVLWWTPQFKNLQVIIDIVGLELVVEIVAQYDYEILLFLLLIVCNRLTLAPIKAEVASHVLLTLGIFGSLVSTKEN
jgi:hypothetical protein